MNSLVILCIIYILYVLYVLYIVYRIAITTLERERDSLHHPLKWTGIDTINHRLRGNGYLAYSLYYTLYIVEGDCHHHPEWCISFTTLQRGGWDA